MKQILCLILTIMMLITGCTARNTDTADTASANTTADNGSVVSSDSTATNGSTMQLTYSITIPEGYTLPKIGMELESKGVCTAQEFVDATQNGDYTMFSLIAEQKENPERCFDLEGYLFPDTYEFYTNDTLDKVIRVMLEHTELKIDSSLRSQIAQSGYTTEEILTIASIIQKEAFSEDSMAKISSVLHNRLESGTQIQCDVTINYVEGAIKPFITGDIDRYNSFYNTYKCKALPAGPICNPGIAAIKAALNPADTKYMFFVTDSDKNYYFSETWEEHEANVAIAMPE